MESREQEIREVKGQKQKTEIRAVCAVLPYDPITDRVLVWQEGRKVFPLQLVLSAGLSTRPNEHLKRAREDLNKVGLSVLGDQSELVAVMQYYRGKQLVELEGVLAVQITAPKRLPVGTCWLTPKEYELLRCPYPTVLKRLNTRQQTTFTVLMSGVSQGWEAVTPRMRTIIEGDVQEFWVHLGRTARQ